MNWSLERGNDQIFVAGFNDNSYKINTNIFIRKILCVIIFGRDSYVKQYNGENNKKEL